jgi:predicted outer membrane repeat protein
MCSYMFRLLIISIWITSTAIADTWTVDDDGKADFDNIQAAIDAASNGDEILVYPGTYTDSGDQVVDMLGKAVWLHSSEGAEATIIDGEYVRRGIFCNSGETLNTIIEGFMITNGNATSGAGMKCLNYSRPTILDCIFLNNTAVGQNGLGGGIYCHQYATPRIESCTFMNNDAGQGGGFYCYGVGEILINDCNFIGNSSLSKGGAISCEHTDISLELCSFQNNDGGDSSFGYGGALSVWNSTATLIDCDFIGNSIENKGGAIDFWNLDAVMTNCTFENNSANYGAGINCGYSEITAVNCSMSGNTALILGSGIYVYYSSVKFVDANEFDEIFVIDESEISFVADSICNVNGDVATSSAGKIRFDIDVSSVSRRWR